MLTTKLINGEIVTSGSVKFMDNYPGFCCDGHDWEVRIIFPHNPDFGESPGYDDIWGRCGNEFCHIWNGDKHDHYRGVSNHLLEDFEELLLEWQGGKKHGN